MVESKEQTTILSTLQAILLELRSHGQRRLKPVSTMGPFTVTPTTTMTRLFATPIGTSQLVRLTVRCRSVGDGTYIAIGQTGQLELRLTDDQGYEWDAPQGYYLDLNDFKVITDGTTGVVEVMAMVV